MIDKIGNNVGNPMLIGRENDSNGIWQITIISILLTVIGVYLQGVSNFNADTAMVSISAFLPSLWKIGLLSLIFFAIGYSLKNNSPKASRYLFGASYFVFLAPCLHLVKGFSTNIESIGMFLVVFGLAFSLMSVALALGGLTYNFFRRKIHVHFVEE